MPISIISPANSFIRFNETAADPLCIWGTINFCLPVFDAEDVYFQFVIEGTELEIDSLCIQSGDEATVQLVDECNGNVLLTFGEKPERIRLSLTQVLYNWSHGVPGFSSVVAVSDCFKIQVTIEATPYGYPDESLIACSNCFERIADDCFTSVVEYGNNEDAFGFKYCNGGNMAGAYETTESDCGPTVISFVGVPTVDIPYTAVLQDKYGDFPTVQVWIYDGTGQLINMGVTVSFDAYPPTMIHVDNGGPASGIVVIR